MNYVKHPQALVSDGLHVPRYVHIDLDGPIKPKKKTIQKLESRVLKLNHKHLFSLTKVADLP